MADSRDRDAIFGLVDEIEPGFVRELVMISEHSGLAFESCPRQESNLCTRFRKPLASSHAFVQERDPAETRASSVLVPAATS